MNNSEKGFYTRRMFIDSLYDDLCRVLTAYETMEEDVSEKELYYMLVDIQNAWETITKVDSDIGIYKNSKPFELIMDSMSGTIIWGFETNLRYEYSVIMPTETNLIFCGFFDTKEEAEAEAKKIFGFVLRDMRKVK